MGLILQHHEVLLSAIAVRTGPMIWKLRERRAGWNLPVVIAQLGVIDVPADLALKARVIDDFVAVAAVRTREEMIAHL
jgi:hypothetical protein